VGKVIVSQRYLHRLPIRPAEPVVRARPSAGPRIRLRALAAVLALFAVSSLAATALERMGASLHSVPIGWPASGCLDASVAPLGVNIVAGHTSLCMVDGGMRGTVDLEHMEPSARYAEWIAYFESPSLCSGGALIYQIPSFNQPCTLLDLGGSQPHGIAREVGEWAADARGDLHADGPIATIDMRPHAQAWLLVSPPAWSPLPHMDGLAQGDTSNPIGRAGFDLP
jgi:hypothetical protein